MAASGIDLHSASVPVFLRQLGLLEALVVKAEAHAGESGAALLEARLADDMYPFAAQVAIAANFALRACFPLAGLPVPPYGDFPATFDGLRARIDYVRGLVAALGSDRFHDRGLLRDRAGEAEVALPAADFLMLYALPNFFFHAVTAYAILRQAGVSVGKGDFDGWHVYGGVR